jgi:hypothetical protein
VSHPVTPKLSDSTAHAPAEAITPLYSTDYLFVSFTAQAERSNFPRSLRQRIMGRSWKASVSAFPRHMKCIVHVLTAFVVMWAAPGHAQTVFPISENDVDASGSVLMCPKSNIYAPCRDTGSLALPVEFGGALNLFLPRHRVQEANADASGTAQANALSTALMCLSRGSTYVPCADAGTLPLLVEVGRARKLFAQVVTPRRNGQRRRHRRDFGW